MDRPAVRSAHTRIRVLGLCVGISLQVLVFWPCGLNGLVDGVVLLVSACVVVRQSNKHLTP